MVENFEAVIGANIREFQRELAEVDAIIRETALGADAMIGADVSEFMREAAAVESAVQQITNNEADVAIDANTVGFTAQAATVQAAVAAIANASPTVTIDANTTPATVATASLMARLRAFAGQRIIIPIEARVNNFQATISRIAQTTRAFGELMQTTMRGISMALSPMLVPILSSVVGLLGQLGPMVGTIAGSTFALGTAFGTAGIGAAAFGAIAVTNLKDIFGASEELKKLDEKLAKADDWKERQKIMQEIKRVQGSLNDEQAKGLEAMNKLKEVWSGIAGALQTQTIQIFTASLGILSGVLTALKPMFTSVMDAAQNLTAALGASINAEPMKNFFTYLNTSAGPMFETITKAVGNFFMGFFSMMEAFGPLATETANGFLKISEGFATWADNLDKSQKFQAFVSYVSENMPKVRSIFSDAIQGIINLFAGFGESSAGMMTSLQNMMERFKEWSSTISANQGFQNFIDYIKVNGPQVVALIGNITTTLVAIGVALAPMGQMLLDATNKFLTWTTALLQTHPALGRIGAVLLVVTGTLIAIAPNVIALATLFAGVGAVMPAISAAILAFRMQLITSVSMSIASLGTMLASAAATAAGWIASFATMVASAVTAAASFVASTTVMIGRWVLMGAQALLHGARVAAAWALTTGAAMASAVASMVATAATFVARWTLMGAQALAQAARMAAAWLIAMGPIGWATAAVLAIAALIIANWDKISAWTKKAWTAVSTSITTAWENAKSKTTAAVSSMWTTISGKFTSMVSTVKAKMESVKSTIQQKWEAAKAAASQKLAELVVAAATFLSQLVSKVREKMAEAVTVLGSKVAEMPGKVLSFVGEMLSAGADLVRGLIDGIKNMGSAAVEAISGVVGGVISKAKSLLDINSPSRVFRDIGQFVGQGMAIGVGNTKAQNEKVMAELGAVMTNTAKANAKAIVAIESQAAKDRAAEMKKNSAVIGEIERKAESSIHQIVANAQARKRKLTASESLRIEKIRNDSAAKIEKAESAHHDKLSAIHKKAATAISAQEATMQKERLDAITKFVDNKQKLEGLSAVQESAIWKRAAESFKAGTQEKIDAQVKYQDSMKKINDSLTSANEEYLNKTKSINDQMIAEEKRLTDAYEKSVDDRAKSLYSFTGLFDEMKTSFAGSGDLLISNLKGQVSGFKDWSEDIAELAKKGIQNGLLEELRAMGPAAYGEIAALNALSSDQLAEYESLWQEKTSLARSQALTEMEGLRTDTELQIKDLKSMTQKQLEDLRVEWVNKIKEVTTGTATQLKSLEQIGKDSIAGLMKGMQAMKGPLATEARAIADSVQKTIKSALQIHSPSRVMETLGRFTGQGMIEGLSSTVKGVMAASESLAHAIVPNIADVQMAGVDIRSDIADMKQQIRQELEVSMNVNHGGSVDGGGSAAAGTVNHYYTIEARNVKEFNDVVRLFDKQKLRQQ